MDKLKHFCVCLAITLIIGALSGIPSGIAMAMVVGVGKEIYDKLRGGNFDLHDLAADAAGVALAMAILCVD